MTFNPDDYFKDERLIAEIPDLTIAQAGDRSLEHRLAGRTGDPDGWIPFDNMVQQWREKPTLNYFDVEYMGTRPSTDGMVNNPEDVDACVVDDLYVEGEHDYRFIPNANTAGGLDWGFSSMSSWSVGMQYKDNIVPILAQQNWSQVRSGTIIKDIVKDVLKYRIPKIYADASHPFNNADLRIAIRKAIIALPVSHRFACKVVEVPFGRPMQVAENAGKKEASGESKKKDQQKLLGNEKEYLLGNYQAYFERRLLRIPKEFQIGIWQHKRYRYQKNSDKPLKEDDHVPDSTMLMLRGWTLGKVRVQVSDENPESRKGTESSTVNAGLIDEVF
jgi:hypothetical protein